MIVRKKYETVRTQNQFHLNIIGKHCTPAL